MKKISILLFLIFQQTFSQNLDIRRSYEISFCGKPQTIKLIEYQNGFVEGFLETKLTRKVLRKRKEIINKTSFDNVLVKKLMLDLKNAGIETLKKCNEDLDCHSIGFLDGDSLSFNIQIDSINKQAYFSEIYPESQTKEQIEKTELRRKVQILITIIDKEINLEKQFSDLIKGLKEGTYCYWTGISKVCIIHEEI
ncbi:hypothetical protein [Flavobacterium ginsengisoli]|uniref:hypothetical protein n=1 Tax=Flavobacterium ginsengisoli TaxID=871694 RepID=UPI0024157E9C|nr:hypothetical protein [Flavobacterium ginsengisoli]